MMDMLLAGLFILTAWITAFTIWMWPMAMDWEPERITLFQIVWRTFQVPIICFGSFFVPDLWLR